MKKKVLEVGCGRGEDFLRHFENLKRFDLYGMDLKKRADLNSIEGFTFIHGDAEDIPYPDNYFDLVVTIGVLEHIQPIEKLCRVLSEVSRVSINYVHIVPAVSTLWEPHTGVFRWQLSSVDKKVPDDMLNFFSDDAWLKFQGLSGARTFRFYTVPLFCTALAIYYNDSVIDKIHGAD